MIGVMNFLFVILGDILVIFSIFIEEDLLKCSAVIVGNVWMIGGLILVQIKKLSNKIDEYKKENTEFI